MAIPAYMEVEGIQRSVTVAGREGTVEILEFNHRVYLPTDRDTGSITGTRKHEPLIIHKAFDKSSALFYQRVTTGEVIPKITIRWYQVTDQGEEKPYFTHELTGVQVASVRSYMFNVKDPSKEQYVHQEEISLRYQKITWTFLDGNLIHTDDWNSR
jgi:type VI secretion system secreted protein Hcp